MDTMLGTSAAQHGDVVDGAPGTISHHLGKLASIALIEPAEAQRADHRERWWRAMTLLISWEPADLLDDPDKLLWPRDGRARIRGAASRQR